jgi:hypothetical protein
MPHESYEARPTPEEEPWGFWDYAGDIAAAPVRGGVGFVNSIYNLADTLTGDLILPDWENNWHSESGAGMAVEGITQFLAGFLPVAGWVGRGGSLFSKPLIGPLAKGIKTRPLVPTKHLTPGLTIAKETALRDAGQKGAASWLAFRRGTLAAMGGDALAFNGHEHRLSNLIQNSSLANPINGLLASEEDDPELVGRLKNALEGMALGGVTEALVRGIGAIRRVRKVRDEGGDDLAQEAAAAEHTEGGQAVFRDLQEGQARNAQDGWLPFEAGDLADIKASREAAEEAKGPVFGAPVTGEIEMANEFADALNAVPLATARSNPRAMAAQLLDALGMSGKDLNTLHAGTPTAVTVRALEKVFRDKLTPQAIKILKDKDVQEAIQGRISDYLGKTPDAYMAIVQRSLKDAEDLPFALMAHQTVLAGHSQELFRTLREVMEKGTAASPDDFAKFNQLAENALHARNAVAGIASEAGRTLRLRQVHKMDAETIERWTASYGDNTARMRKDLERLVEIVGKDGNPTPQQLAGLMRTVGATPLTRFGRGLKEYWINAILFSGPTMLINSVSNSIHMIYRPMEKMLGAALTGNKNALMDELHQVSGFTQTAKESLKYMVQSWKAGGEPLLTGTHKLMELRPQSTKAISSEALGMSDDGLAAGAVNWFARNVIYLPTRVLGTADEFAKQMTFRMEAKKLLRREALDSGVTDPQALAEYIGRGMDTILIDGQKLTYDALLKRGYDRAKDALGSVGVTSEAERFRYAHEYAYKNWDENKSILQDIADPSKRAAEAVTFTADLPAHSVGRAIQNFVAKHPMATPFAPFIRTPSNILGWTIDRTAGNMRGIAEFMATKLSPNSRQLTASRGQWMQDYIAGGTRKAEAVGRLGAAVGITWGVLEMAESGRITGRGPEDREQRKLWEQAGNLPYSIQLGDTKISYSRMDPWATLVGVVADLAQFSKWSTEEDREGFEYAWAAVWTATTENLKNKTYLRGLESLLDMFESEERRGAIFNRFAGSVIPRLPAEALSGFQTDPYMREVVDFTDVLARRVPGFSRELEPVRNVLGEPVHRTRVGDKSDHPMVNVADMFLPTAWRYVSDDVVYKELAELNYPFQPPRAVDSSGTDFREFRNEKGQTAFDRMLELRGTMKFGGKTLKQSLRKIIQDKRYQAVSSESDIDSDSPRIGMLKKLINAYQRGSRAQMLQEYPDLLEEIQRKRLARFSKLQQTQIQNQ